MAAQQNAARYKEGDSRRRVMRPFSSSLSFFFWHRDEQGNAAAMIRRATISPMTARHFQEEPLSPYVSTPAATPTTRP